VKKNYPIEAFCNDEYTGCFKKTLFAICFEMKFQKGRALEDSMQVDESLWFMLGVLRRGI
jgi:hypothetical protein